MYKRIKLFIWLVIGLFIFTSTSLLAQTSETEKINKELVNLENFDGETSIVFNDYFNNAKLIGLGEATHGTSDFFKIKSELIKNLIINKGFRIVIFEGSYANSSLINNYITNGEGNVYKAIFSLGPWAWYTEEVLELIEWLKLYNESKPSNEKVIFYGCDIQSSSSAAKNVIDCLQEQGTISANLLEGLQWIQNNPMIRNPTKDQRQRIKSVLSALGTEFQSIPPQGARSKSDLRTTTEYCNNGLHDYLLQKINIAYAINLWQKIAHLF